MQHTDNPPNRRNRSRRRVLVPFALLLGFWLVLTPDRSAPSLAVGAAVAAAITAFCRDILFTQAELPLYHPRTWPRYLALFGRLLLEIVKANIEVAGTVLNPRLPIRPQFVKIPLTAETEFNRTVYANCITITPGTLAVDLGKDHMLVHALTDDAARQVSENFIAPKLQAIENSVGSAL